MGSTVLVSAFHVGVWWVGWVLVLASYRLGWVGWRKMDPCPSLCETSLCWCSNRASQHETARICRWTPAAVDRSLSSARLVTAAVARAGTDRQTDWRTDIVPFHRPGRTVCEQCQVQGRFSWWEWIYLMENPQDKKGHKTTHTCPQVWTLEARGPAESKLGLTKTMINNARHLSRSLV